MGLRAPMVIKSNQLLVSITNDDVIIQHVTLWFDHPLRYRVEIFLPSDQYHVYLMDGDKSAMAVNETWVKSVAGYSTSDSFPWLWSMTSELTLTDKFKPLSTVNGTWYSHQHQIQQYTPLSEFKDKLPFIERDIVGVNTDTGNIPYWIQSRPDEFTNVNITLDQKVTEVDSLFPWFDRVKA